MTIAWEDRDREGNLKAFSKKSFVLRKDCTPEQLEQCEAAMETLLDRRAEQFRQDVANHRRQYSDVDVHAMGTPPISGEVVAEELGLVWVVDLTQAPSGAGFFRPAAEKMEV